MTRHDSNKETGDSSDKGSKASDNAAKEMGGSLENQKSAATMVKDARKQLEGKNVVTQPGQEGFKLTDSGKPQAKQVPEGNGDKTATPTSGPTSDKAKDEEEAGYDPDKLQSVQLQGEATKLTYLINHFDAIDKAGNENGRITAKDVDKYIKENKGQLSDAALGALNYAKEHMDELQDKVDDKWRDKGFSKADLTTDRTEVYKEVKEATKAEVEKAVDNIADAMEAGRKSGKFGDAIHEYYLASQLYGGTSAFGKQLNEELHKRGVLPKSLSIDANSAAPGSIADDNLPIISSDGLRDQFDSSGIVKDKADLPGKNLNDVIDKRIAADKKIDAKIEKDVEDVSKAFASGDYNEVIKDFQDAKKDYNKDQTNQYVEELNEELHAKGILPPTVDIDASYLVKDSNAPGIPLKDKGGNWYSVYDSSGKDITIEDVETDYAKPRKRENPPDSLQDAIYTAKEVKSNSQGFIDPFNQVPASNPSKKK